LCVTEPGFYAEAVDSITIKNLAVLCRIGVPDEERAKPQRLLITVSIKGDFTKACASDDVRDTINYFDVSRRIAEFCRVESFRLIEKLAHELVGLVFREFGAQSVKVQVKKFILSDARYVSFELQRDRTPSR
jgi:FolB domain-containing protein